MAATTLKKSLDTVIVGGHGKIAQRLTTLLTSAGHNVTSIIRSQSQSSTISSLNATPLVLSLEDSPAEDLVRVFEKKDLVYFTAGSGGKGGADRTKKVDYEGAVKVFDAIEAVEGGGRPRLVLVSAMDIRDGEKVPEYYNEQDKEKSKKMHEAMPEYVHWKYEADKELVKRTAFEWFILRPATLTDDEGTGKGEIGAKVHLGGKIARDDVAKTLFLLATRPQAAGLALDLSVGDKELGEALDEAINIRETAFPG